MPLYDSRYWCERDDTKYSNYVNKLVELALILIDHEYEIYFYATQQKDNNVIYDVLENISIKKEQEFSAEKYVLYSNTVDELIANILPADIIIATRFHGTVLSLLCEKPMVGICYYRKARELLYDMEQGDYSVELDSFTVDEIWEKFQLLHSKLEVERKKIINHNDRYLCLLNQQYDNLIQNLN
jgi:polysaccharide pyruvyl transferase WcaK-like protein